MDSLTLSPSLLDIICLLNRKDILSCTRVNRRLYGIIRRYENILPRPETELRICTRSTEDNEYEDIPYLRVQLGSAVFYLTQNRIRLRRCLNDALTQSIKTTLTPCLYRATFEERLIFYHAETSCQSFLGNDVEGQVFYDFQSECMEDGIVQLLTFAFASYNFKKIHIFVDYLEPCSWSMPVGWYDIIAKLFLRSRSKCTELHLGKAGKEAARLYENIGSQLVQITSFDCLFDEFVLSGRSWSRPMTFNLDYYDFDSMTPFNEIIAQWKRGTWHMMGLYFISQDAYDVFDWSREELVELIYPRPLFVRNIEVKEGTEDVEIFIDRPGDDFVLCISYNSYYGDFKELMMYDVRCEDLDSFEFDYCRFVEREELFDQAIHRRLWGYGEYRRKRMYCTM